MVPTGRSWDPAGLEHAADGRSIWHRWGRQAASASVAALGGSSGAAACLLSARTVHDSALRNAFAYPLEAVRWTAQRLAGIDPELAVDEAVDQLIAGYCAGLAELAKADEVVPTTAASPGEGK